MNCKFPNTRTKQSLVKSEICFCSAKSVPIHGEAAIIIIIIIFSVRLESRVRTGGASKEIEKERSNYNTTNTDSQTTFDTVHADYILYVHTNCVTIRIRKHEICGARGIIKKPHFMPCACNTTCVAFLLILGIG